MFRQLPFLVLALCLLTAVARAQDPLDQDATLRGVRSLGIVTVIELQARAAAAVDTQSLRRSLETAVELELRRTAIAVRETLCSVPPKCGPGFGILGIHVQVLDPEGAAFAASYQLDVRQIGTLASGYTGYLSTWSIGGLLHTASRGSSLAESLREGINGALRSFLNAYLKFNPR